MRRRLATGLMLLAFLMVMGCAGRQVTEDNPYQPWDKAAIALYNLEKQYGRLMQSETLPLETKQNLRDEVWPVLDEAFEVLQVWKIALDGGATVDPLIYNDKINRLIDEIERGLPAQED